MIKRLSLGLLIFLLTQIKRAVAGLLTLIIAAVIGGAAFVAIANYTATQGTGTNFASVVISSTHYLANMICDFTVGQTACATVKAPSTAAATTDTSVVVAVSPNTPATLGDGTNGPVAVKPPSTSAIATDPALVMQISPTSPGLINTGQAAMVNSVPVAVAIDQSPIPITTTGDTYPSAGNITVVDSGSTTTSGQNSVTIVAGTPTAASFYTAAIDNVATTRIKISGTWTGTLTFEGSQDSGTTWVATPAHGVGTVYQESSVTGNGAFDINSAGLTNVRVRATATMTGTAVAQFVLTSSVGPVYVNNPLRIVDNASGNLLTIDSTGVKVDASGATVPTTTAPVTSGGLSTYFVQPTAGTNAANIKASAGQVYKIDVFNNSATVNYLRLYNTASSPTCSSATGLVYQLEIPALTTVGGVSSSWDLGMAFSTGIGICVTGGYATTDTTNATASAMAVNIGYK